LTNFNKIIQDLEKLINKNDYYMRAVDDEILLLKDKVKNLSEEAQAAQKIKTKLENLIKL
jgi:uncharacterized coiled-coil protein SlyX